MNKKQIILSIFSVVVLAIFIAIGFHTSTPEVSPTIKELEAQPWPSGEIEKVSVNEKNQYYTINADYPKTNSEAISLNFKTYIEEQIAQFKDDTSWVNDIPSASEGELSLDITYKNVSSPAVQGYIFNINSYTGGAHGLQVRTTFSFNKEGQLLTLANLFSNGIDGLKDFSKLVQKELMKREGANADWIDDGAAPREENYRSFVVTDTGLTILLDPYQVAPYSDGSIDVSIPLADFAKIANPEIFPVAPNR